MDKILDAIGPFLGSTILWFVLAGIALYMYLRYRKEANAAKPKEASYDYRDELLRVNDRILQDLESITASGNVVLENPKFADPEWHGLMQSYMDYFKQDGADMIAHDLETIPDEYLTLHKTYVEGLLRSEEGIAVLQKAMNNKKADMVAAIEESFICFEEGSAKTDGAISLLLQMKDEPKKKKKS
ncbi:MAG: hypothetical protein LBU41_04060 [Clostridiales Family XIII bacterium]|jgi:hypothetical protein|nr:hypothetical protein [Clostridiales Family XIII bacterium]